MMLSYPFPPQQSIGKNKHRRQEIGGYHQYIIIFFLHQRSNTIIIIKKHNVMMNGLIGVTLLILFRHDEKIKN